MSPHLRCAIYTRKSSEEGLEQDFNSLHAQREACEAYIKSQKHEGWHLIKTAYDDGGISGGTMQRPALQQLLADIAAKKVDVIVVYKVDRLTRALADFARMVELFDQHSVSFVSITQQFNTTTSMGRLTLNVLLSFAQFEREVTGERIRDKIKASRAKGMWMGGSTPLGYQVIDKKLVPHPADAETLNTIFRLYLEVANVRYLVSKLDEMGIKTRPRSSAAASRPGGCAFSRGALYTILSNPVYIGKSRHREQLHEGLHEAIVDIDLWEAVQAKLKAQAASPRWRERVTPVALLKSKLKDAEGRRLVSTSTIKRGRRYRYYISEGLNRQVDINGWRLPGQAIEDLIYKCCQGMLSDAALITRSVHGAGIGPDQLPGILQQSKHASKSLGQIDMLTRLVGAVTISPDMLTITLKLDSLIAHGNPENKLTLTETIPVQLRRRFNEMRLVMASPDQRAEDIDAMLVRTIARGHVWFDQWLSGEVSTLKDIAICEGVGQDHVTDVIKLACLAPEIVEAIIQGQQPPELSTRSLLKLSKLPIRWSDQMHDLNHA